MTAPLFMLYWTIHVAAQQAPLLLSMAGSCCGFHGVHIPPAGALQHQPMLSACSIWMYTPSLMSGISQYQPMKQKKRQ